MIAETSDALSVPAGQIYAVMGVLWAALVVVVGVIWDRSKKCEAWRDAQEPIIREMMEKLGIAQATTDIVNSCNVKDCPFAGKLVETYSVSDPKTKRRNQNL